MQKPDTERDYSAESITVRELENVDISIISCDFTRDYNVIYASGGFYRFTGYTKEQFAAECGNKLKKIIHPDDAKHLWDSMNNQLDMGVVCKNTYRVFTRAGDTIWVKSRGAIVRGEKGRAVFSGIIADVSDEIAEMDSEREYNIAMTSDTIYANEVNITKNLVTDTNYEWSEKIGLPNFTSLSDMINYMCENIIHPSCVQIFRGFFNRCAIEKAFDEGKTKITAEYLRADGNDTYRWVENTMNIIRDKATQDIMARLYVRNIDERKQKELKAMEEQRFYEAMLLKDSNIFEVNISKDVFVSGAGYLKETFGIDAHGSYSQTLEQLLSWVIHPDDVEKTRDVMFRTNLILTHAKAISECFAEFRILSTDGEYMWRRGDIHLFEDPKTGEIKGFCYVKDINERKTEDIELHYRAEHDALTELYNKDATENLIENYLISHEGCAGRHAILMFDIDYFKAVNDNFGHVFGDVVLSKVGRKTGDIFRADDICGRIGGDEFLVLMKNIQNDDDVLNKAEELKKALNEGSLKDDKGYKISISIGVAFYNADARRYRDLYVMADTALYRAKQEGRGRCCLYSAGLAEGSGILTRTEGEQSIESVEFGSNIWQYIFKLLYDSIDKSSAIESVLELLGRHYGAGRAYIFERTAYSTASNTFEWCDKGVTPKINELKKLPMRGFAGYEKAFDRRGVLNLKLGDKLWEEIKKISHNSDNVSIIGFKFAGGKGFDGFLGFDRYKSIYKPVTEKTINELKNISRILGVFIAEMRIAALAEAMHTVAESIANAFDVYSFVVDRNSHRCLFVNDKLKLALPAIKVGAVCYKAVFGRETPCEFCTINKTNDGGKRERRSTVLNKRLEMSTVPVMWINGESAALVAARDVSEEKDT